MANQHRIMERHYDVTMEPILTSEMIVTENECHRIIMQLGVFIHFDFKR